MAILLVAGHVQVVLGIPVQQVQHLAVLYQPGIIQQVVILRVMHVRDRVGVPVQHIAAGVCRIVAHRDMMIIWTPEKQQIHSVK